MNIRSFVEYGFSSGLQDWLGQFMRVQSIGDFVFFRTILDYLRKQISDFGIDLMGSMMVWVGGMSLVLMTLWVLIQGFRIVTGRSRDSMMVLVTNMARAALIVSAATTMGMVGHNLQDLLTKDLKRSIAKVVTGSDETPESQIDKSLAWMQVGLSSIDAIKVLDDDGLRGDKGRAMWAIGLGTGGPAVVAGSMLLLYEVAMALFIGLGPLFILCLLFDQTKQLFQRWLLYGVGTMFSMAVLAAMVSIALDMVIRVAAAFWTTALIEEFILKDGMSDGMTSQAMQQGGMGLILTTLIITAPPMAAMFFQGTLGSFMAYSQIGGSAGHAQPGPQGQPPGASYMPATYGSNSSEPNATQTIGRGGPARMSVSLPDSAGAQQSTGRLGAANNSGA